MKIVNIANTNTFDCYFDAKSTPTNGALFHTETLTVLDFTYTFTSLRVLLSYV